MSELESIDAVCAVNHGESGFTFSEHPAASGGSEPCCADENTSTARGPEASGDAIVDHEAGSGSTADYSGVTLYLREIGRVKRLTRLEELELVARHRQGDVVARERLITANLRLVVAIARSYEGFGLPLLDLISEGNIGLTRAVDRFDPSRGATLATYAFTRIRSAVARAICNYAKTVRVPVNVFEHWSKLRRAEVQLRERCGREPNEAELSEYLGYSVARVSLIRRAVLAQVSLDAETEENGHSKTLLELTEYEDPLSPSEELERSSGVVMLHDCLKQLQPAEAETLVQRFGLDGGELMTLESIGRQMGVTREGVRQIERRALKKLRRLLRQSRI